MSNALMGAVHSCARTPQHKSEGPAPVNAAPPSRTSWRPPEPTSRDTFGDGFTRDPKEHDQPHEDSDGLEWCSPPKTEGLR
jgi:hypothetical protein